jgi:hypothetical protein
MVTQEDNTNKCFNVLPLREAPTYKFLTGNEEEYKKYTTGSDSDPAHNAKRFRENAKTWERSYNPKNIITVDNNNVVHDGKHRASWLMHKCGETFKVIVLKIPELGKVNTICKSVSNQNSPQKKEDDL